MLTSSPNEFNNLISSTDRITADKIKIQLNKILLSDKFKNSSKLSTFLQFVVEESLAGRSQEINQFLIARQVFASDADFNPQINPIVRIQASRVRRALDNYYLAEGNADLLIINIPKGSYTPRFRWRKNNQYKSQPETTTRSLAVSLPRIAVMPFVNNNGNLAEDFWAEGISEELSFRLTHFDLIAVVAHYSTLIYRQKNSDIAEIRKQLKVDYLFTGSIYIYANTLRMYVQLVETNSEKQIWAEQFDISLTIEQILPTQDAIIRQIATILGSRYGVINQRQFQIAQQQKVRKLTTYEAILKMHHYLKVMSVTTFTEAIQALEKAVMGEPNYGQVWALLGMCYYDSYTLGIGQINNPLELGAKYCQKAVSLTPHCQDVQIAIAMTNLLAHQPKDVILAAQKAIALNPNASYQVGMAGWFIALAGEFEQGIEIINQTINLNPHYPSWFHLANYLYHYQQGEYELALQSAQKFGLSELFWSPLLYTAVYARLGNEQQASINWQKLLKLKPDFINNADRYLSCYILPTQLREQIREDLFLFRHKISA